MATLTADERETVIRTSDADDYWVVTTHQRSMVTHMEKLVRNGNAEKIQDLSFGGHVGGEYLAPSNMVTLRNPTKKKARTVRRGKTCKATTLAGKPCKALATKNGFCFKHQED